MHSACLSTFPARTARLGVRTVATHPNAARAAHKSPLGFYNSLVHSGILKQNTSQIRALKGLDTVLTEVLCGCSCLCCAASRSRLYEIWAFPFRRG